MLSMDDQSGNGRPLVSVPGLPRSDDDPQWIRGRLFTGTYEPLELVCGSYSASEKPRCYLVADVRRWAKGDFADLHSTPREIIATLAETIRGLLQIDEGKLPIPRTWEDGLAAGQLDPRFPCVTYISVRVELRERHTSEASPEWIAARLNGLQFHGCVWGQIGSAWAIVLEYEAKDLERWARGDQRDLHVDAVTAMSGLAGEVLRLAGLEPEK